MKHEMHVLGIDIAKRVFHAVGMDERGNIVYRKRVSRHDLMPALPSEPSEPSRCRAAERAKRPQPQRQRGIGVPIDRSGIYPKLQGMARPGRNSGVPAGQSPHRAPVDSCTWVSRHTRPFRCLLDDNLAHRPLGTRNTQDRTSGKEGRSGHEHRARGKVIPYAQHDRGTRLLDLPGVPCLSGLARGLRPVSWGTSSCSAPTSLCLNSHSGSQGSRSGCRGRSRSGWPPARPAQGRTNCHPG